MGRHKVRILPYNVFFESGIIEGLGISEVAGRDIKISKGRAYLYGRVPCIVEIIDDIIFTVGSNCTQSGVFSEFKIVLALMPKRPHGIKVFSVPKKFDGKWDNVYQQHIELAYVKLTPDLNSIEIISYNNVIRNKLVGLPEFHNQSGKILGVDQNSDLVWVGPPAPASHTHSWSDINKTGAKISDLDVPEYTGNSGKVLAVNANSDGLEWLQLSVTSGNIMQFPADPDLLTNDAVNLYVDNGVLRARKADASLGYETHGFAISVSSGSAQVLLFLGLLQNQTGLSIGSKYYLSTSGSITTQPPQENGWIVQEVGLAVSESILAVRIGQPILLGS